MELEASISDWVLANLPFDRDDPNVLTALQSKRPGELLVLYLNWRHRVIGQRRRHVEQSVQLAQHSRREERAEAIAQIASDIEEGKDLTKYLSRRVRTGFALPPKPDKKQLGKLQHLDLLLNDWGIHHLHLSTALESDGFVERDDPLMFVIFRQSRAYILDIGNHSDFAHDRLVQIAVENWPEDGLFLKINGVRGQRDRNYSPTERAELRKAGLASMIQIGEAVYVPPGGISTAGTSSQASFEANRVLRKLRDFEQQMLSDPSGLLSMLRDHGFRPAENPKFSFTVFDIGYGVIETTSNAPIRLE